MNVKTIGDFEDVDSETFCSLVSADSSRIHALELKQAETDKTLQMHANIISQLSHHKANMSPHPPKKSGRSLRDNAPPNRPTPPSTSNAAPQTRQLDVFTHGRSPLGILHVMNPLLLPVQSKHFQYWVHELEKSNIFEESWVTSVFNAMMLTLDKQCASENDIERAVQDFLISYCPIGNGEAKILITTYMKNLTRKLERLKNKSKKEQKEQQLKDCANEAKSICTSVAACHPPLFGKVINLFAQCQKEKGLPDVLFSPTFASVLELVTNPQLVNAAQKQDLVWRLPLLPNQFLHFYSYSLLTVITNPPFDLSVLLNRLTTWGNRTLRAATNNLDAVSFLTSFDKSRMVLNSKPSICLETHWLILHWWLYGELALTHKRTSDYLRRTMMRTTYEILSLLYTSPSIDHSLQSRLLPILLEMKRVAKEDPTLSQQFLNDEIVFHGQPLISPEDSASNQEHTIVQPLTFVMTQIATSTQELYKDKDDWKTDFVAFCEEWNDNCEWLENHDELSLFLDREKKMIRKLSSLDAMQDFVDRFYYDVMCQIFAKGDTHTVLMHSVRQLMSMLTVGESDDDSSDEV